MSLVLQAEHLGLRCHQMAGWEERPVRAALGLPDEEQPIVVVAVGYEGDLSDLDERTRAKELKATRSRKAIADFVHRDLWGRTWQGAAATTGKRP
jgi:nitroreductase